jgi:O-antigen biosynthesis protein WbqP
MFSFSKKQKLYLPIKRLADIFFSFLAIILLSPLLLLCSFITLFSSHGHILFKQQRVGKNEKMFTLLKFRSMKIDAPQVDPDNLSTSSRATIETKWGAFMRKTSLDELPQLFNILIGQMSFVGPRPSQGRDVEGKLIETRESYNPSAYLVKPGLSGYAQIHLHRDYDIDKKARDDSFYVQHISMWFDIKIFVLSLLAPFGVNMGK